MKFKTDMKCEVCFGKVAEVMNADSRVKHWEADMTCDDKIITVQSDELSDNDVIELVRKAGFNATPIRQ